MRRDGGWVRPILASLGALAVLVAVGVVAGLGIGGALKFVVPDAGRSASPSPSVRPSLVLTPSPAPPSPSPGPSAASPSPTPTASPSPSATPAAKITLAISAPTAKPMERVRLTGTDTTDPAGTVLQVEWRKDGQGAWDAFPVTVQVLANGQFTTTVRIGYLGTHDLRVAAPNGTVSDPVSYTVAK